MLVLRKQRWYQTDTTMRLWPLHPRYPGAADLAACWPVRCLPGPRAAAGTIPGSTASAGRQTPLRLSMPACRPCMMRRSGAVTASTARNTGPPGDVRLMVSRGDSSPVDRSISGASSGGATRRVARYCPIRYPSPNVRCGGGPSRVVEADRVGRTCARAYVTCGSSRIYMRRNERDRPAVFSRKDIPDLPVGPGAGIRYHCRVTGCRFVRCVRGTGCVGGCCGPARDAERE